jgi:hypothetical protein
MAPVHLSQSHHRSIPTPVPTLHQSRSLPCKFDLYRLYSHRYPRIIFLELHLRRPSRHCLSAPPRIHPQRLGLAHALPRFRRAPAMWDLGRLQSTIARTPSSCHNCGIRSTAQGRYGSRRLPSWRRKCGPSRTRSKSSRRRHVLLVGTWYLQMGR